MRKLRSQPSPWSAVPTCVSATARPFVLMPPANAPGAPRLPTQRSAPPAPFGIGMAEDSLQLARARRGRRDS